MNGENYTIHEFPKLRPMKKYVKQTSWLKFRIVTHVNKSLSSWNRSESSESFGKATFFFFKVSPIKLPSPVPQMFEGIGNSAREKDFVQRSLWFCNKKVLLWELVPQDPVLQKNLLEVTGQRGSLDRPLPIAVHSDWLMGLLFLNPFPQHQVETVCKWDADFQYNGSSLVSGLELKLREMWQYHQLTQTPAVN